HPYRSLPNAPRLVGALLDAKAVHGGLRVSGCGSLRSPPGGTRSAPAANRRASGPRCGPGPAFGRPGSLRCAPAT
ncbi:ABC transporter ATP-binding protein, partial [Streptomyces sp. NPDC052052]